MTPKAPVAHSSTAPSSAGSGGGCAAALAYLRANAAPGFAIVCPGYADGHQAMSCYFHAPQCPNGAIIVISVPCRAAYMNEAHNSWVVSGRRSGAIDPYGYCH